MEKLEMQSTSTGVGKPYRFNNESVFYAVVYFLLTFLTLIVLYPLIYIVSASFSDPSAVASGRVYLFPVNFSLEGYKAVFSYRNVYIGYRNTLFYTSVGTLINVTITLLAAYPLSRKDLPGKNRIMFLFAFTMIFSGGMIPAYLLVKNLGMLNTPLALLIPGALSVYNMIITRTFFQANISQELLESAQLDGSSDFRFFSSIVLPLSKAIIAVNVLFYAVGHWNAYFNAFLYLNKRELYPLQMFLREILVMNSISSDLVTDPESANVRDGMADLLKYALIIVSSLPILMVYPFAQKHFIKGVMIGSLKG